MSKNLKTGKNNLNIVYAGRYNESEYLSGPEKVAKRIFSEHSKIFKTYFIQYFFDGNRYSLKEKLFGIKKEQMNDNSVVYTLGIFRILPVFNSIKPNIVHVITFERFAVIFFIYKLLHKIKIIYNEHGVVTYENYELKKVPYIKKIKDKFCEKMLLKYSDKIIFTSERTIDIAEKYFKINESKIVILSNGIDEKFYIPSKTAKNNIKPKVIFIYKNELYKSALNFLKKFIENYKGDLELYIITKIGIDFKCGNNIGINLVSLKTTDGLAEFYNDKDVFLSLNKYDTFSISTAEAMASGLIPIITKETGISRYIDDNYNGYIVDFGNIDQLKDKVTKISNMSADQRNRTGENAKSVYESLAWNKIYETYNNIYQSLIK